MTASIFGIKNCDTVKKALKWLEQHNVDYQFEDLKKISLPSPTIEAWLEQIGTEQLINKRSKTWKELPDDDKGELTVSRTIYLIKNYPTLIKRPLVVQNGKITNGFNEATWQEFFNV